MQNIPSWFFASILAIIVALGGLLLFTDTKIVFGDQKIGFNTPRSFKIASDELSKLNEQLQNLEKRLQTIERKNYNDKIDELTFQLTQLKEKLNQKGQNHASETISSPDNSLSPTVILPKLSSIEILSEPKFDKGIITQVSKGSKLLVLDKQGSWYKVKTSDGKIGWTSEKWVREIN